MPKTIEGSSEKQTNKTLVFSIWTGYYVTRKREINDRTIYFRKKKKTTVLKNCLINLF